MYKTFAFSCDTKEPPSAHERVLLDVGGATEVTALLDAAGTLIAQWDADNTVYTVEVMTLIGAVIREGRAVLEPVVLERVTP